MTPSLPPPPENYVNKRSAGLIPRLKAIQEDNISFNTHIQTYGTGWSIAGMTAYFFGIPLKSATSAHGNEYGDVSKYFLPNATSIIEILEEAEYEVTFVSGYDTVFAGYNKLISTHSKGKNLDRTYFMQNIPIDENNKAPWGYSDAFIFEQTIDILKNYKITEKPFALILKTSDVHPPTTKGHIEKFDNDLADFIADILALDFEDTTIIIIGDHLYMESEIDGIELTNRSIYNCFINPAIIPPSDNTQLRTFGHVDIAPTILEAIGCKLLEGKFGLGVSLFRDIPTLLEDDIEQYQEQIKKQSKFYNSFF